MLVGLPVCFSKKNGDWVEQHRESVAWVHCGGWDKASKLPFTGMEKCKVSDFCIPTRIRTTALALHYTLL